VAGSNAQRASSSGMKTFVLIWSGQLVSTLGSGLTSFALGVWILESTGSPTLFSLSLAVFVLPNVALAPVVGVVADRWDRRVVMLLSDSGAGLSSLAVAALLLSGELEVWHVYVAGFVNSAFSSFQWPAYSATTSLLVPKEHLGRAGGMTQIGEAIGQLATPAIAGALFVSVGLRVILVIDVLTYLVAVGTLLAVRFPRPEASTGNQAGASSFWKEAVYGWIYIRGRPGLFGLLTVFAALNFLLNTAHAMFTPLVLGLTTPDTLGYINSIGGLGMLIGTLLMSAWGGPTRRVYGIVGAESLVGFATLLFGLGLSIPLMAVNSFWFLFALPISNGCSQAIWQTKVAPEVQGRVFSIRSMIAYSTLPLAALLAGPLAERVFEPAMAAGGPLAPVFGPVIGVGPGRGIALIFVISGTLYVLATQVILIHPRIGHIEDELPDAVMESDWQTLSVAVEPPARRAFFAEKQEQQEDGL
jgi:DHA3 family macrolide efflux protein-like MFS transporter